MEIAKCSFCSQEVSEAGQTYYEAWEKKKEDFGMGRKEKIFCENCWKEQEKNYRNYPLDTEEVKRGITQQEIEKINSKGFYCHGDYIAFDPTKKEWVKEEELTPINPKNEPVVKGDKKAIWVILIVFFLFIGYLWLRRKRKSQKRQKIN